MLSTWTKACLLFLAMASYAQAAETPGRQFAVLIGVEKYHRAAPLRFTLNDVHQVSSTLRQRGDWPSSGILEMMDTANDRYKPLRANLLAELPKWFQKAGPKDTMFVYFSGHGFRDEQAQMYLAPQDCDPDNPEPTGIAVAWLREQLAACPAEFKILVIDSCHAGSEKGDEGPTNRVDANQLAATFEDLEGVVTIASCTADQRSQIWDDKQQSLFTYWLVQGLKGHADTDRNGNVDIDELYKYVSRNVSHTSEVRFPLPQSPVRIVRPGTIGVPVVVQLQPQSLKGLLSDMAEQLSLRLEERQLGKVGVLEFTNYTPQGPALRADFGLLGSYCADELERQLSDLGTGRFSVMDRARLQKALSDEGFAVSDLGDVESIRELSDRLDGLPVLVVGALQSRAGQLVNLQCKLLQRDSDESAGIVGGTAHLTENEWAMLGRSVAVQPNDYRVRFNSNQPITGNGGLKTTRRPIRGGLIPRKMRPFRFVSE